MVHLVVPCQVKGTASSAMFREDNPFQLESVIIEYPAACVGETLGWTSLVVDASHLQERLSPCYIFIHSFVRLVVLWMHPRAAGEDQHNAVLAAAQSHSSPTVLTKPQVCHTEAGSSSSLQCIGPKSAEDIYTHTYIYTHTRIYL